MMTVSLQIILIILLHFNRALSKTCNVLDFGAVGDGITDDTYSIQNAMDNCTANDSEISIILFPSSYTFYIYPIRLNKNNLHLWLDTNSTLYISPNFTSGKWPMNGKNYINIIQNGDNKNLSNISIFGNGLINGNGQVWYPLVKNYEIDGRPHTIWIQYSQNITIYNITILNSPAYNIYLHHNRDVIIHHINITTPNWLIAPNTDGIDINSINVHVYDCYIENGDDSYCLEPGAENVIIENSTAKYGLGLAASSNSGINQSPMKNVIFRNIFCDETYYCMRLKTGALSNNVAKNENGTMWNITFENITLNMVNRAIEINQFNETVPYNINVTSHHEFDDLKYTTMNNITFEDIYGTYTEYAGHIDCSQDVPCKHLEFDNIDLIGKGPNVTNPSWFCSANVYGNVVNVTPPLTCLS